MADAFDLGETVELAIGGSRYAGWTSVTVTRSLDSVSGTFELALTTRTSVDEAEATFEPGAKCRVLIGDEPVIDGWVDAVSLELSESAHSVTVSGRDRTADLVDCSAVHKPGSWRNARIEAIAGDLAKPFGVSVTARTSTGAALPRFAIQQGETVQAAIERLLRFRGLLMVPTASGDLEIVTPSDLAPIGTLAQGENILSVIANFDDSDRFSDYLVKGQASGSDDRHGKAVSQIRGEARDSGVKRHRPLIVVAEDQSDGVTAEARAKWEAGVRAGRAVSIDVTTLGWRAKRGGPLWRPNVRARLRASGVQAADRTMLVTAVTLSKGDEGTLAVLTLMPPGAWAQLASGSAR